MGDLLERCRRGERTAFESVVQRFSGRVLRLAFNLLGHAADAEDVVQETFLQAFLHLHSLQDVRAFSTWLSRIASRLCLRRLKRRRLMAWLPLIEALHPREDPMRQVDVRDSLSRAVQALSPPLRVVVVLRDVLDHSYQEIADILQVPEGTVKSRLNAARQELRRRLSCEQEEVPCPVTS